MENIKIQSKKKIPVDHTKMMHAVKIAFRNLFGLSLICDPIIMKITELRLICQVTLILMNMLVTKMSLT